MQNARCNTCSGIGFVLFLKTRGKRPGACGRSCAGGRSKLSKVLLLALLLALLHFRLEAGLQLRLTAGCIFGACQRQRHVHVLLIEGNLLKSPPICRQTLIQRNRVSLNVTTVRTGETTTTRPCKTQNTRPTVVEVDARTLLFFHALTHGGIENFSCSSRVSFFGGECIRGVGSSTITR